MGHIEYNNNTKQSLECDNFASDGVAYVRFAKFKQITVLIKDISACVFVF